MLPSESSGLFSTFLHLAASQIATRIISFVFNVLVTRQLSPDVYGYSIQFHLLISTILYLSREGFRRGCLRSDNNTSKVASVAWLTVPAGVAASLLACAAVLLWTKDASYKKAVILYGCASIIEILSEPCYIIAQNLCLVRLRVTIETIAALSRCLLSYVLLVRGIGKDGGLVFAYGQVAYGVCLFLGYWGYFTISNQGGSVFRRERHFSSPDRTLLHLCGLFTFQSVQKFVLQEAEKFILIFSETTYNQGVYGLVENLGSLVVRTFLQTFEESVFTQFSKAYSEKRSWQGVENSFLLATKLVSILGLTFAAFGPSYSYVLLRLLYGTKWSDGEASSALSLYCIYVMVMAVNGVTEAFLHAVVSKEQLRSSNTWLLAFSVAHVGVSIVFIRMWGCVGLILANALNMLMRIIYSTVFIRRLFKDSSSFSARRALPAAEVLLTLAAAAIATNLSAKLLLVRSRFNETAPLHIATGLVSASVLASSIYLFEKSTLNQITNMSTKRS